MTAIWARVRREAAMMWAFWSVRVSAVLSMLAAWLVAEPDTVRGLLDYVPEYWRPLAGVVIGIGLFAVHWIARRAPQPGLKGAGDGVA